VLLLERLEATGFIKIMSKALNHLVSQNQILTLVGKVTNKLSSKFKPEMASSKAKLKARRKASRQKLPKIRFYRVALLLAFTFALLKAIFG
jgi:hypothetical protein